MHQKIALLLILAATATCYWPGMGGPLVFDDFHNLEPVGRWLNGQTGWISAVFGNESGLFGRPISMASFALGILVLGSDVWWLKLTNLLIHLANGFLAFLFFQALAKESVWGGESPKAIRWLPVLCAAVWLLHPLLVSTVLYVVQRMAMLSATFVLLALLAFLYGRSAFLAGRTRRGWEWIACIPFFTLLAALSKENGVLVPALCGLIELFVFLPRESDRIRQRSIAFICAVLVLPALAAALLTLSEHPAIVAGYANRPFSLFERLLTQPRVLWDYVSAFALPQSPAFGLYTDHYLVSRGLLQPFSTLLAMLGWLFVCSAAWMSRKAIPGFSLGVGMFLVSHALESTVFPLLIYFEHRNYLPAIGLTLAFVSLAFAGFERLATRMHQPRRLVALTSIGLLAALSFSTLVQSTAWSSKQTLLEQGLRYHPESRWLRLDLIAESMQRDPPMLDEAHVHADFLTASADSSTARIGAVSSLLIECSQGQPASLDQVERAFAGQPEPLEADMLRVFESLAAGIASRPCANLSRHEMAKRLSEMLDRTRLAPSTQSVWRLRFRASNLYLVAGNQEAAISEAKLAWEGGTADPQVAVFLAQLHLERDDMISADTILTELEPRVSKDDLVGTRIVRELRQHIDNRTSQQN